MATHKEVPYSGFIFSITKQTDEDNGEPINVIEFQHEGKPRKIVSSYREPVFESRNAAFDKFDEKHCAFILSVFGIKDKNYDNN